VKTGAGKRRGLLNAKPNKAQAQIYNQISRGLTDVLMEYELLGDINASQPFAALP